MTNQSLIWHIFSIFFRVLHIKFRILQPHISMKTFITLIFAFSLTSAIGQNYKLVTLSDLPTLLQEAQTDRNQQIERQAALEFHKLINQYRKSQNIDSLAWDETFWLTSRNHSLYLAKNADYSYFSHDQVKNRPYFSGIDPGNRLSYVDGNKNTRFWTNENILQNNIDYTLTSVEQIAKQMAKDGFNQWKKSPGHNANMLNARGYHGVAFIISGSNFYGTDLFGTIVKSNNTKEKNMNSSYGITQEEPEKLNVIKAGKEIADILEKKFLAVNAELKKDKELTETSKEYVQARIDGRGDNMEHESFSAINTKKKRKTTQVEMFVFVSQEEANFKTEDVANNLFEQLINGNEISLDEYRSMGFTVKVKRKKSKLETYIILILEKDNS